MVKFSDNEKASVRLSGRVLNMILSDRQRSYETVAQIIERRFSTSAINTSEAPCQTRYTAAPLVDAKKYSCMVLRREVRGDTLPELFGEVVLHVLRVAPEVIEAYASETGRKRAFVSRDRWALHPGRPDLPFRALSKGWYISANVGKADVDRALRKLNAYLRKTNMGSVGCVVRRG